MSACSAAVVLAADLQCFLGLDCIQLALFCHLLAERPGLLSVR